MSDSGAPLSDDERAELEALRASQAKTQAAAQAAADRAELAKLRKRQKYAEEDAKYYAEKAKRKAQREYEREHPDYSLDDLEPMSGKQKVVIAIALVAVVVLIAYLVWYNVGR